MSNKPHWQREQEALDRLGFCGINGSADRQRAAEVVAELLREIERLRASQQKREG